MSWINRDHDIQKNDDIHLNILLHISPVFLRHVRKQDLCEYNNNDNVSSIKINLYGLKKKYCCFKGTLLPACTHSCP